MRRPGKKTRMSLRGARQRRMWKRAFIGEAECAVDCIRGCSHLKPLQQRYVLGVIGEHLVTFPEKDGHHCVGKHFDRIALLEIVLTKMRVGRLVRELPARRCIVEERIGKGFGRLVRESGYVLEPAAEDSGGDPARILGDPARLGYRTRLEEEGVETQN